MTDLKNYGDNVSDFDEDLLENLEDEAENLEVDSKVVKELSEEIN